MPVASTLSDGEPEEVLLAEGEPDGPELLEKALLESWLTEGCAELLPAELPDTLRRAELLLRTEAVALPEPILLALELAESDGLPLALMLTLGDTERDAAGLALPEALAAEEALPEKVPDGDWLPEVSADSLGVALADSVTESTALAEAVMQELPEERALPLLRSLQEALRDVRARAERRAVPEGDLLLTRELEAA